jgi:hypothetical protein
MSFATVPASAGTGDVTIPIPLTHAMPSIIAASGNDLIRVEDAGTEESFTVSVDGGKNWAAANISGAHGSVYVTDGHMYYQSQVDDGYFVDRYDFATNTTSRVAQLDDEAMTISATHAVTAVDYDADEPTKYVATDLSTGATHPLAFNSHHTSSGAYGTSLSSGDNALVTTSTDAHFVLGTGYLDLLPLDGAKGLTATVRYLNDARLRGDQVVYLTQGKTGVRVCFRSAKTWRTRSCKTLKKSNAGDPSGYLYVGPDWTVVTLQYAPSKVKAFVIAGTSSPTSVAAVHAPAGATLDDAFGAGDTERPFVDLATSTGGYVASYRADGTFVPVVDYVSLPARLDKLGLTPASVVATDDRPTVNTSGYQAWSRAVTDGLAGEEHLLAPRASSGGLIVSGARTIIRNHAGVALLDGGQLVRKLPKASRVSTLSGAYYLARTSKGNEMRRIDGTQVLKRPSWTSSAPWP